MRKTVLCFIVIVMLFGIAGCNRKPQLTNEPKPEKNDDTVDVTESNTPLEWCAQYIRTNGCQDSVEFPSVQLIHCKQDLQDYYTSYHELFNLERLENSFDDGRIGFLDACDKYDDEFFQNSYLIFVLLEEGSGSVSHKVQSVEQTNDKKISISINRQIPEVGTADMAQWHIMVELCKDAEVASADDVLVYLDDKLAFNGCKVQPPKPEAAFQEPPKAILRTTERDVVLNAHGYHWKYERSDGTVTGAIADQLDRPADMGSVTYVPVLSQNAETVYAPIPGGTGYAPTNSLGYYVKLMWETVPTSVRFTCWPDEVWEDKDTPEEAVVTQDTSFYAKQGGYIYEFFATWKDTGKGYWGTANYYVYISDKLEFEESHIHMPARNPQIVENPVTGYCGNTWTTVRFDDWEYGFMYDDSVVLTDILINLDYKPEKVCKCKTEFFVDTEFGANYGVNLSSGYVRCEKGQADLTAEQIKQIREILERIESQRIE